MDSDGTKRIHAAQALLPNGWARDVLVTIGADGRIASVETDAERPSEAVETPVLLPGLPNLHSHTFQRAMAGLSEARGPSGKDSFWTWREIMYRFLDLLSPEDVEAIAAFAFMEMLEAGFCAVAEFHYLHNQPGGEAYEDGAELAARIVAGAGTAGIGLTLLPVHYAQGGVDGRPLAGGQLRFANDLDSFARLAERCRDLSLLAGPDANWGVAPHSLRAVPRRDLIALAELAPDRPIHMHLAEQEAEVEETLSVFGARPVEWLLDNHDVDGRWCLIHCTQMTGKETVRLAASGAVAGLCPVTEASLGDGIFNGRTWLEASGRFGVGTDSNIAISAVGELRQLEYSQRLRDRERAVLTSAEASTGRRLFDLALAGGAKALGRACGAIAAGSWADLMAVNPANSGLHTLSGDRILDGLVFAGHRGAIDHVWSAGRHVVVSGRHVARDAIAAAYASRLSALMDRL
jgi:formimidoylglutamate deiminase